MDEGMKKAAPEDGFESESYYLGRSVARVYLRMGFMPVCEALAVG